MSTYKNLTARTFFNLYTIKNTFAITWTFFRIITNVWLSRWSLVRAIRDFSSYCFAFWVFQRSFYFHQVASPFGNTLEAQGIPIAIFFDDGVGSGPSSQVAKLTVHWSVQIFLVAVMKLITRSLIEGVGGRLRGLLETKHNLKKIAKNRKMAINLVQNQNKSSR